MNLLLVELDGLSSIEDRQLLREELIHLSRGPSPSTYLDSLYDMTFVALERPLEGTRSILDSLADQKWRIVFLSQRARSRETYHTTVRWLNEHGFDAYSYDLVLKEHQFSHLSTTEWKVMKMRWYAQEPISPYRDIVLIEPLSSRGDRIQEQWNTSSDVPLHIYSSVIAFAFGQLQHERERKRPSRWPGGTLVPPTRWALKEDKEEALTPSETIMALNESPLSPTDEEQASPSPNTEKETAPSSEYSGGHESEPSLQTGIAEQARENTEEDAESYNPLLTEPIEDDVAEQETSEHPLSPFFEEDIEDEETQEEELPRIRKRRVVKSSLADEDEHSSQKKQSKYKQRERQAHRGLKSLTA